jgi:hypothetical protein
MVVGSTTTWAIRAYHHNSCEFGSQSERSVQHYVIKFVSDLRQVGAFLWVLQFSSTNKTDRHNITEILLKVALNTTTVTFSLACPCSVPLEECSNLTRDGKPTPSLQTSMYTEVVTVSIFLWKTICTKNLTNCRYILYI